MIILSGRCLSVRYIVIACGSGAESVLEKVVIIFAAYTEGSQLQQERAISSSSFIRLLCLACCQCGCPGTFSPPLHQHSCSHPLLSEVDHLSGLITSLTSSYSTLYSSFSYSSLIHPTRVRLLSSDYFYKCHDLQLYWTSVYKLHRNGDSRISCRATIPSPNQTKLCLISQTAAWLSGSHMDSLWTSLLTFPIAFLLVEAAKSIKSDHHR